MVRGAGVVAEQRDDDVAIVDGVVPEEDFAEIHAGARGAGGAADVRPAERAGNGAFEESGGGETLGVGRQSVDEERKAAPRGDDGRDVVPVVGIVVDRDDLLVGSTARGAAHGVEAESLLPPLQIEQEVGGAVLGGDGDGRSGPFGDLLGLRPEHHRAAVGREVLARGERGGGVGRGEVERGVVREDRIGGGAELRGEDDLRRLALARPAHRVDLREGRDFERLGHRLLLDGGVPPDLEGTGADAVDDRGVGVGVGRGGVRRLGGGGVGLGGRVDPRVPDRVGCGLVDEAGAVGVAGRGEAGRESGDRAAAQPQFGADADVLRQQREEGGVGAQDRADRYEPDVVVPVEPQHRPALARRAEGPVRPDSAGVALRLLVLHQRGGVFRGNVDRAAGIVRDVAADEDRGVLRPVAGVLVELEGPLHLHLVRLHPVDLHVPGVFDGGPQRIDVAVLGAVGVLPLVLVVVVAAVVGRLDDGRAGA